MGIQAVLQGTANWLRRNVGAQDDYRPADSFVNGVRRNGMAGAAVGAGVGAAAGAAGGYALGLSHLADDRVTVATEVRDVTRPVLVGADFDYGDTRWVSTDDKGGGYFVTDPDDWDPIIENRPTGQSTSRQVFRHTMSFGPVAGALVGLGAGAVIGGITGALAQAVVNRGEHPDPWSPPRVPDTEQGRKLARAADKAPLAGAAAGALLGGAAGYAAGEMSQARAQTLTQVIQEPVTRREVIGWIPYNRDRHDIPDELWHPGKKIYYSELPRDKFGETPFEGREAIHRSVPTGELSSRTVTESSHRLTPLTGTLLGAGVGAGVGVLTGVAAGVLMKAVAGEDPPRGW